MELNAGRLPGLPLEFLPKGSFEDLERLLYDEGINEKGVERFFLEKMKISEKSLNEFTINLLYNRGACKIYGINYNNPGPKDFKIARRIALREQYESRRESVNYF